MPITITTECVRYSIAKVNDLLLLFFYFTAKTRATNVKNEDEHLRGKKGRISKTNFKSLY